MCLALTYEFRSLIWLWGLVYWVGDERFVLRVICSSNKIVIAMFVIDIGGVLIKHMVWHFTWFWRISH